MTELPFAHLNLRRNPFGEFSASERAQLAFVDIESALAHLVTSVAGLRKPVVQCVGEKGFGKTTHLLSLAARLPDAVYVYLPEDERVAVPRDGDPLIVDEAQRLTLLQRLQVFRSDRALILGTHVDFALPLQRAGRKVLTLEANRNTTPHRVAEILNARIHAVRRSDQPVPTVTMATAERLFEEFGPDLRSMQHLLYDVFQKIGSVQDV